MQLLPQLEIAILLSITGRTYNSAFSEIKCPLIKLLLSFPYNMKKYSKIDPNPEIASKSPNQASYTSDNIESPFLKSLRGKNIALPFEALYDKPVIPLYETFETEQWLSISSNSFSVGSLQHSFDILYIKQFINKTDKT